MRDADRLFIAADEFEKLIRINVSGVMHSAQAAARAMFNHPPPLPFNPHKASSPDSASVPDEPPVNSAEALQKTRGSIVLIGSMSGRITNQGNPWTAYNASKAAVLQMARSLGCEWGAQGIRVNSISPGYIWTAYVFCLPSIYIFSDGTHLAV